MREISLLDGLGLVVRGIAAAVIAVTLVVGGFVAGLSAGHPVLAFGLPILGGVLSLFLVQGMSESDEDSGDDPFTAPPGISWRLCDPELRNSGVWRAQFERAALDVAALDDPARSRREVERLIKDWSFRIGYHYRVVRVDRVTDAKARSSRAGDDRWRTYRVTLDIGGGEPGERAPRQRGRLRIGDGLAEFQLDPPQPHRHAPDQERLDVKMPDLDHATPPAVVGARGEPMWDRWLDG
jgi:hypothetical protein